MKSITLGLFALQLQACAGNLNAGENDRMPQANTPEYVDVVRVVVQICLPNKTVGYEDAEVDLTGIPEAKTLIEVREANGIRGHKKASERVTHDQGNKDVVRKWIPGSSDSQVTKRWLPFGEVSNTDGVLSAGGGSIYLVGDTEKNQPIYEQEGRRQKDYIALEASVEADIDGERQMVKYWFKLPAHVPTQEFSHWQEPISQESKAVREKQKNPTFWNLTHERAMEIYQVGAHAPKMRFKLMSVKDYYDENRFWYRARKVLADQFYRGVTGEAREKLHFVPKRGVVIPGC